jgi:hypothetical protein
MISRSQRSQAPADESAVIMPAAARDAARHNVRALSDGGPRRLADRLVPVRLADLHRTRSVSALAVTTTRFSRRSAATRQPYAGGGRNEIP